MAGRSALLPLRSHVPDPADHLSGHRCVPERPGPIHPRQHHRIVAAQHRGRLLDFDPHQPCLGHSRRADRPRHRHRHRARRAAALGALHDDDVFRRRFQFRRRTAGLRLPGHARPTRSRHRAAQSDRHRYLRQRLQHPVVLGFDAHLSLLPDSADGGHHHAGDRRAEEGVGRGGGHSRRHAVPVLAHGGYSR